jgi:hypothetical protein
MQWWLICARGLVWPALVAVAGVLLSVPVSKLASLGGGHESLRMAAELLPLGGFAIAALLVAAFAWRLRAWETGGGHDCQYCGGPCGRRRDGVVMYGKQLPDFRRCYNCDRNTPD